MLLLGHDGSKIVWRENLNNFTLQRRIDIFIYLQKILHAISNTNFLLQVYVYYCVLLRKINKQFYTKYSATFRMETNDQNDPVKDKNRKKSWNFGNFLRKPSNYSKLPPNSPRSPKLPISPKSKSSTLPFFGNKEPNSGETDNPPISSISRNAIKKRNSESAISPIFHENSPRYSSPHRDSVSSDDSILSNVGTIDHNNTYKSHSKL